jgi:hypothetical protein
MVRMEVRAGDGGSDAEMFAQEFAEAVSKHSGASVSTEGKTVVLHCL